MRRTCIIGAGTLAVLAATPAAAGPSDPGRLVVEEQREDAGRVYIEGYYSYLKIRRARDGELVLRRRYETIRSA